jgi:hypothetical protein
MKIIILFINLLFVLSGCKEDPPVVPPPPPPPPVLKDTIEISVLEAMHRSIVLNIKTTANVSNSFIELYRTFNNTATRVAEYPITVTDTTILDDNNGQNLQLNTDYTYYAVRRDSLGEKKETSNIVTAKTLNTTEFNYYWQEFSIGEWNSVLSDVWGTDENNVYAVGTVMFNDSAYGIIKWNGVEWTREKSIGGLQAIHGFSETDIWTVGGGVYHYNGVKWNKIDSYTSNGQSIPLDTVLFNNRPYSSVWGTSSSNMYFGNGRGKIVHWDGSKATLVYSYESNVQVKDLDGIAADFIVGVGAGFIPPLLAVYYNGISWNQLPIDLNWSLNSTAIVSRNHIYFGGDGIFEMKGANFFRTFQSGYYIREIEYNRQNGVIVAAGPFDGVYIHNGIEWRDFRGQITSDNTSYSGIFLINNTIFCVGSTINQAKIIIGKNN